MTLEELEILSKKRAIAEKVINNNGDCLFINVECIDCPAVDKRSCGKKAGVIEYMKYWLETHPMPGMSQERFVILKEGFVYDREKYRCISPERKDKWKGHIKFAESFGAFGKKWEMPSCEIVETWKDLPDRTSDLYWTGEKPSAGNGLVVNFNFNYDHSDISLTSTNYYGRCVASGPISDFQEDNESEDSSQRDTDISAANPLVEQAIMEYSKLPPDQPPTGGLTQDDVDALLGYTPEDDYIHKEISDIVDDPIEIARNHLYTVISRTSDLLVEHRDSGRELDTPHMDIISAASRMYNVMRTEIVRLREKNNG